MLCQAGRHLPFAIALLASLRLIGCQSNQDKCEDLCERSATCPDSSLVGSPQCGAQCGQMEDLSDAAGCGGAYGDLLDCADDIDDPCAENNAQCTAEVFSYLGCVLEFCETNPNAPECRGFSCTTGTSGSAGNCSVTRICDGEPEYTLDCNDSECACERDGTVEMTVAYDAAFCEGEHDAKVDAAAQACGWP